MAIYKCKMCGGSLEPAHGETVCKCSYCGTVQTLPQIDSERIRQLFDRANSFRLENDFDSAAMVYENIIAEYPEEAEAHWGVCLCRYGIEYVEDPRTKKRLATCHRTQFRPILEDPDFAMAVRYADGAAESVYREEAAYINAVQRKILDISRKEEPFDIFICYKETDSAGNRTTDSVIAQDIYEALTDRGYRVFFSRITLEDKLGREYEPYIFAALNSAQIMLAVGTKPDNFNSVWVKNEWSRYLALAGQGQKKTVIPCYRDMSPYDLPQELRALQSQDVSKVGYMQDLLRGIEKIAGSETVVSSGAAVYSADAFVQRAMLFLEDENFSQAEAYCEKALDADPKNASAYLARLMAELGLSHEDMLMTFSRPIGNMDSYEKAYRFAEGDLKKRLYTYEMNSRYLYAGKLLEGTPSRSSIIKAIGIYTSLGAYSGAAGGRDHAEKMLRDIEDKAFSEARALVDSPSDGGDYLKAKIMLEEMTSDRRSADLISICSSKLEEIYQKAGSIMRSADSSEDYAAAQKLFEQISGYKDAGRLAFSCSMRHDETSEYEQEHLEEERRKNEAALMEKKILEQAAANQKHEKRQVKAVIFFAVIAFAAFAVVGRNIDASMDNEMILYGISVIVTAAASCILSAALIMIEWAAGGEVSMGKWQLQKLAIVGITTITSLLTFHSTDSVICALIVFAAHCAAIFMAVKLGKVFFHKNKS